MREEAARSLCDPQGVTDAGHAVAEPAALSAVGVREVVAFLMTSVGRAQVMDMHAAARSTSAEDLATHLVQWQPVSIHLDSHVSLRR